MSSDFCEQLLGVLLNPKMPEELVQTTLHLAAMWGNPVSVDGEGNRANRSPNFKLQLGTTENIENQAPPDMTAVSP